MIILLPIKIKIYNIVYDNSMTYIGYGEEMSFFNASGEVMYLTGINSKANMDNSY